MDFAEALDPLLMKSQKKQIFFSPSSKALISKSYSIVQFFFSNTPHQFVIHTPEQTIPYPFRLQSRFQIRFPFLFRLLCKISLRTLLSCLSLARLLKNYFLILLQILSPLQYIARLLCAAVQARSRYYPSGAPLMRFY